MSLPDLLARLRVDTSDLQGAVGRAQGIGGEIAGALGVGLTAGGGIAAALEQNTSKADIQNALGLSPAEAAKAAAVSGDIYANAWGDSLEGVNDAVAAVAQNLTGAAGASSPQLKGLTTQAIALADAFGQEVGPLAAAAGQMIKTGMAKNAQEAFDTLTVGFQNGTNKADDLLDTFNEYGTQFRKIGLDGPTALGLLSQGLQAGARDSDIVADSLKEFSIRSLDALSTLDSKGRPQLTELGLAFDTLGLNGEKMQDKIAAGGPGATAALSSVLAALRNVEDPTTQARTAVALFGTQAEDMGAALFALDPATAKAAQGMGKLDGAAKRVEKTAGAAAAGSFEELKRQVKAGLGDAFTSVLPALTGIAAALTPFSPQIAQVALVVSAMWAAWKGYTAASTAAEVIGKAYTKMTGAKVRDTAASVANKAANVATGAADLARTLGTVAVTYGRLALAKARDTAASAANAVANGAGRVAGLAASIAQAAAAYGALALAKARDTAATVGNAVAERAATAAKAAGTAIQWALNVAMTANPIGLVIAAIVLLVGGLILLFKNSETARNIMLSVWNAIKTGVTVAVNAVKSVIVSVFNAVRAYISLVVTGWRIIFTTVWRVIVAVVQGAIARVRAVISGIGAIVGVIGAAFSRARSAAVSALGSLLSFVRGIPGKVLGFFSSIGGKMAQIGGNLVDGLRNGISDAWGRVTSFIRDMVNKIPLVIRKALGIASPSKVTRKLGFHTGEGFALGLRDAYGNVQDSLGAMIGMPAAAAAAAQFPGMSASSRTYAPVFMVGGQGPSARELMDESAWRARAAGLGGVVA